LLINYSRGDVVDLEFFCGDYGELGIHGLPRFGFMAN